MFAYLVHHAEALPSDVDPQRPLSPAGRARAEQVAETARVRGAKPAAVWHSGKLRARQTAEACWRVLNPLASFTAVRGLQPDDDPDLIATALAAEPHDVLVAGHLPHLGRLLERLTGRGDFPSHGCVALERTGDAWVERWRI